MRPHRSTVIAVVALVFSMTGGAIAAVNYARNAGAVDGKSAVSADAGNRRAAGKLVAMDAGGKLPFKFLGGAASTENGAQLVEAPDNGESPPRKILDLRGSILIMTCADDQPAAGVVNPTTRLAVFNQSGGNVNVGRRSGTGRGVVNALAPDAGDRFDVGGQATFDLQVQSFERTVLVQGAAHQLGQGTASGQCSAFATALFAENKG